MPKQPEWTRLKSIAARNRFPGESIPGNVVRGG